MNKSAQSKAKEQVLILTQETIEVRQGRERKGRFKRRRQQV